MEPVREIARRDEVMDIELRREPELVLEAATRAAKALKGVVDSREKKLVVGGKQYLFNEDWQTIGQFYGYTVRTLDPEPVEVEGVKGAKAKAELVEFRSGLVVGGAEAYCMRDEENWANKPWFQLASMAQTRAASKAMRNRLGWVVVLQGYEPTPAEEMTSEERAGAPRQEHWCPVHNVAFRKMTSKSDPSKHWYSHKTDDGQWCNEDKVKSDAGQKTETPRATRPVPPTPAKVVDEAPAWDAGPKPWDDEAPVKRPSKQLMDRWAELWTQAQQLGIEIPAIQPDISEDDLIAAGKEAARRIQEFSETGKKS